MEINVNREFDTGLGAIFHVQEWDFLEDLKLQKITERSTNIRAANYSVANIFYKLVNKEKGIHIDEEVFLMLLKKIGKS